MSARMNDFICSSQARVVFDRIGVAVLGLNQEIFFFLFRRMCIYKLNGISGSILLHSASGFQTKPENFTIIIIIFGSFLFTSLDHVSVVLANLSVCMAGV